MTKFITKNHKKIPINKVRLSEVSLKTLSNKQLSEGLANRKKLNKSLVEGLIREKTRRTGKDTCGICGDTLPHRGTCKRCDAEDAKRAMNWSTMTDEQRRRFFRRHGLENDFAVNTQAKLPFSKLTKHWQDELKKDGFGK